MARGPALKSRKKSIMRKYFINLLLILVLLTALIAPSQAAENGENAPDFELHNVNNEVVASQELLTQGSLLIWFPASLLSGSNLGAPLVQASHDFTTPLVIIPATGKNHDNWLKFCQLYPNAIVLEDPDGSTIFAFTGSFTPGLSPRRNLFAVNSRGIITWQRFWPGVTLKNLENILIYNRKS